MQTSKIYFPCMVASALLLAGNLLQHTPSLPLTAYPHVQLGELDDPGGLLILDKKWIFPAKAKAEHPDVRAIDEVLAIYGQ